MLTQLIVAHKNGHFADPLHSDLLEWKTCLRHIYVGHKEHFDQSQVNEDINIYSGPEAIQFLMEIACGLHSPLVAETEVFGQYRQFISDANYSEDAWGRWLRTMLESIRLSVKKIRRLHLIGLGSQSYGSLIRRKTKDFNEVHLVGAGQLVDEILPWLAKFTGNVVVHCRDLEKAQNLKQKYDFIELKSLSERAAMREALVVCAPLPGSDVAQLVSGNNEQVQHIFDLRGESKYDPIGLDNVECLQKFFKEMEEKKAAAEHKISMAKSHINELLKQQFS